MASTFNPPDPPLRMLACRISQTCNATVVPGWNPQDFIPVSAGELGYILGRFQRGNMIFFSVEITHGKTHKMGLVPESVVTVGASYAETVPVQLPQELPSFGPISSSNSTDDVLMKTLRGIWDMVIESGPNNMLRPADRQNLKIRRIFGGPGVKHYADIIYRCIHPEAKKLMLNGYFDPRDFIGKVPPAETLTTNEAMSGTYLMICSNISQSYTKLVDYSRDGLYTGQALNIRNRAGEHFANIEGGTNAEKSQNRYTIARTSSNTTIIPFIIFRSMWSRTRGGRTLA